MGLFDKLFGKKKVKNPETVIPALPEESELPPEGDVAIPDDIETEVNTVTEEEQKAPVQNKDTSVDAVENPEISKTFRGMFRKHFPTSLDTVENHMQLPYMVASAVEITPVIEYARNNVYSKFEDEPEKLPELSRVAVAKVAMALEKYLLESKEEDLKLSVSRAHSDSLEKAWIVLDFYCQMLKGDYTDNIRILYGIITGELSARGSKSEEKPAEETYEDVLERCAKAVSGGADADEIFTVKAELFAKLYNLDRIYAFHDDTFNSVFPYVGADGKLEIQTNEKRAAALKDFIESKGDSKVSVHEYAKGDFERFFSELLHNGLTEIRLDNGTTPVELDIADYYENDEENVLEVGNRYMRGRFISELQYGYRLKNLLADKKDSEEYRVLYGAMLGARSRGYRALAGGLVYAFNIGGAKDGVTLYTPKALERAKDIMKVMGVIDEKVLIAPGDDKYDVFEGELALRAVQKKDAAPEEGLVCAFSDKENAEKIHARFTQGGANDAVVVVTLAELCSQCAGSAGFILDMSSYGIELPKEMFIKISEYVKGEGLIVAGKDM